MELLVEIFAEIFFEIFFELCGWITSKIAIDKKKRKIVKYIIAFFVFACCLALLIYSLVVKKMVYTQVVLCYFLLLLLCYVIAFINKNMIESKLMDKIMTYIKRCIHYSFPIVIIIFANLYKTKYSPIITIFAIIAIVIYFFVIACRIVYRDHTRMFSKKSKRIIARFNETNKERYLDQLQSLMIENSENTVQFISECNKEELECILKIIPSLEMLYTEHFYEVLASAIEKHEIVDVEEILDIVKNGIKEI